MIHKRIADHRRRVARLNRYVIVVALLWLVTSFALLFLSTPGSANAAQPRRNGPNSTLQAQHGDYSLTAVNRS